VCEAERDIAIGLRYCEIYFTGIDIQDTGKCIEQPIVLLKEVWVSWTTVL